MSQYTVFYNSDKEIEMVLNGQADSATISAQEGTGLSTLVVDVEDTPTSHYYVNDAEDNIVEYSNFSLTVSATEIAIDNTAIISNIPEGTEIIIQKGTEHLSTVIMDSTESLKLTGTIAGSYNWSFSKDRYYSTSIIITVGGQT